MKKLIMIFLVLASVSFAANDNYEVIEIKGENIIVKELSTGNIITLQKPEAIGLGIDIVMPTESASTPSAPQAAESGTQAPTPSAPTPQPQVPTPVVTVGESFANVMMPGSSQGSSETAGDTVTSGETGVQVGESVPDVGGTTTPTQSTPIAAPPVVAPPVVIPPMDIISGTVTEAYGAK